MQLEQKLEMAKMELRFTKQLYEYEKTQSQQRIRALETKYQQLISIINSSIEHPFYVQVHQQNRPIQSIEQAVDMSNNRKIQAGRDNIEISENAQVTGFTTGEGDTFQGDYAQKLLRSATPQSSQEEIVKLLSFIQQELPKLPLSDDTKEEVLHEVKGAEIQAKKDEPDKEKIAGKLKNATESLKGSTLAIKEAVTIGNLLGQAILWCGEQWVKWM